MSAALAMEAPTQDFIGQAELSNQKTQQISWDKIQELYQVYEKTQSPSIRTEIIHDLNRLLLNRQLDPSQREEALIMVEGLKAHHLALRLQQDQSPQEYGDLNALPQEIIHEIIQALVQDQVSFKDLKGVLFANKSFHKAMMSAPINLNLSPYRERITDDVLVQIIEIFPNIASINLTGCNQISDTGLEHLKVLTQLTKLNLAWCSKITDNGLAHLRGLPYLTTLNLAWCNHITNAGLEYLKVLNQLSFLSLVGCNLITDAGLSHLKELTQLTTLIISKCDQITDVGLMHLKGLNKLTKLYLKGVTQITEVGKSSLMSELRLLRIISLE